MDALLNVSVPLWVFVAYMVFMCAVQAMERPTSADSRNYRTLYRFLHLLCMNLALFADPTKKLKSELPPEDVR